MIILSGGANGSDKLFGELGIETIAFSFNGHNANEPKTGKVIKIPYSELTKRKDELSSICNVLKRNYPKNRFIEQLLLRNMYQIKNKIYKSDIVIAISTSEDMVHVDGGTGYAVERAKIDNIPILMLDKNALIWYIFDYSIGKFVALDKDIYIGRYNVITGIGSRNINNNVINIITKQIKDKKISNKREKM